MPEERRLAQALAKANRKTDRCKKAAEKADILLDDAKANAAKAFDEWVEVFWGNLKEGDQVIFACDGNESIVWEKKRS